MLLLPIESSTAARFGREKIIKLVGLVLIIALTLSLVLAFFLGKEPKQYWYF